MSGKSIPRSIGWFLGLAFVFCGDLAAAQSQPQTLSAPPAEKYAVAPGGVDMRTGTYTLQTTDLSAGSGDDVLNLTRILGYLVVGHDNPFGNFSSNWDIMLTQKRINIDQGKTGDGSGMDYQVSVRFGGRSQTFRASTSTGFSVVSMAGYAQLAFTGDRNVATAIYTFTAGDGTKVVFRPPSGHDCSALVLCAYASSVTSPDGTAYTLNYDGFARLKSVVGNRGYALLFDYGTGGSLITKACIINLAQMVLPTGNCPTNASATTTYNYVSAGGGSRLSKVTDAAGKDWTFAYAGASPNLTMAFKKPGAATPWLTNTIRSDEDIDTVPIEVVTHQTFADGRTYDYAFAYSPQQKAGEPLTIAGGSYVDNLNRSTTVAYDFPIMPGTGHETPCTGVNCPRPEVPEDGSDGNQYQQTSDPATIVDPLGRTTVNYFCDPNAEAGYPALWQHRCLVSLLQWTKDPEGGKTYFTWQLATRNVTQVRKVAKPGSGLPDIVSSATYDCTAAVCMNKPTSITDPRGKVSTFDYDTTHGGIVTVTSPADASGIKAVKRYAYVQRYAWVSDGLGGYVRAAAPVWLLAGEKTCRATATVNGACAGGAADEIATSYEYGPDSGPNLLFLRGTAVTAELNGVITTLRTCFTYDALGRKVSETKPIGTSQTAVCS